MLHDLQRKAIQVIEDCYNQAWDKVRVRMPYPKVSFDLTGTTAGVAYPTLNRIKLNNRFLFNNTEAFLRRTTTHECCHIFAHQRYQGNIKPHGIEWQSFMEAYGAPASRCHNYLDNSIGRKPIMFETGEGIVTCQHGLSVLEVKL